MKLKEINDAVVHCGTKEEAEQLINSLNEGLGTKENWIAYWDIYEEETCYRIEGGVVKGYDDFGYYKRNRYTITEFSDLIEPEEKPVLTAEEAIEWLFEHYYDEEYAVAFGINYTFFGLKNNMSPAKIVDRIAKWKAEHEKTEKKEPELEWYWEGTIYKKNDMDDYETVAKYDTGCRLHENAETYMECKLKQYCMEHEGEYIAQVDHVCRVKRS